MFSRQYAVSTRQKKAFKTKRDLLLTVFCLLPTTYCLLCAPLTNAADTPTLTDVQALFMDKEYAKAKDAAVRLAAQTKNSQERSEAFYYAGVSELWLGQYASARDSLKQVIKAKPSSDVADRASLALMDTYYMEGDYKKSLETADDFLKDNSTSEFLSAVYLKVARCHFKLANWKRGREYLQKVVQKYPNSLERFYVDQLLQESQFFAVQVGSFTDRYSAEKLTGELNSKGEYAYIVEAVSQAGKKIYRVRVGKLQQFNEAQKLETRLSQLGYPTKIYP
jgi:TolA-binding protein